MAFETNQIRNIVLLGHGGAGKTSLNESMLYSAKAIHDMGKVDDGKSVSDYHEQEIEKKMSIRSSLSFLEWKDTRINIIDTPGSPDFTGEVVAGIYAADAAVFVINAESGVEIETIKKWRRCQVPKIVFINKMSKDNANFENCLNSLKENFKDTTFVPRTIPIGKGKEFKGVIDLIDKESILFEDSGKKLHREPIKEETEEFSNYYTQLIEAAVETDEALMNKYFEGESLSHDELVAGLHNAIENNALVPVLCGDSLENIGVKMLLDGIVNYMPSPEKAAPIKGFSADGKEITLDRDSQKTPVLFVFKTEIDQFAGKLSFFKVKKGLVTNDMELYNPNLDRKEKCGKLFKALGKKLIDVHELASGDIGVFVKLSGTQTNHTLCDSHSIIKLPPMDLPQPVFSQTITTPNKKDEEKLIALLQKASEEDPTFKIEFNSETKENVVSGMGEMQINLILNAIKTKNKIESVLNTPKIAFRETIRKKATAEYTHKKQSGGHGQYGKVVIEIFPLEAGKGYEFTNAIVGGVISKGYIPGCEKGFHEAMEEGVLAGYKVVDVGIKLFDGKEHPVDSSEMSFKIASRMAFKEAMRNASPVLLEPIMDLSVYANQSFVGDILSDLSSKRGRVQGQETLGGGIELIKAYVPLQELVRYSIDLKSITSGTGSFEMSFYKYQPLTGKIADEIIAKAKAEKENG